MLASILVILGESSVQVGAALYGINALSLLQAIVLDRLQGRVSATLRIISIGVVPFGALLGGFLDDRYGLRITVFIAGGGTLLAFLCVFLSCEASERADPT